MEYPKVQRQKHGYRRFWLFFSAILGDFAYDEQIKNNNKRPNVNTSAYSDYSV